MRNCRVGNLLPTRNPKSIEPLESVRNKLRTLRGLDESF
jgi:hypothetical protein